MRFSLLAIIRDEFSGAGKFSVMMEERTRGEAQQLGTAATIGMFVLLLIAYRRIGSIVLIACRGCFRVSFGIMVLIIS